MAYPLIAEGARLSRYHSLGRTVLVGFLAPVAWNFVSYFAVEGPSTDLLSGHEHLWLLYSSRKDACLDILSNAIGLSQRMISIRIKNVFFVELFDGADAFE